MDTTIQLTSGRGPAECCHVVAQVLKILLTEADARGLKTEVLHREKGEQNSTLLSAAVLLYDPPKAFLSKWIGTIKWVGKSNYRPNHPRKNWYIGIHEIQAADQLEWNEKDVIYEVCRASGPGGQHVNKVSTAVRAKHKPTGLAVACSESRSQFKNRQLAKSRLRVLFESKNKQNLAEKAMQYHQNHKQIKTGSPVRTFTGSDFKKVRQAKCFKKERLKMKSLDRKWIRPEDGKT